MNDTYTRGRDLSEILNSGMEQALEKKVWSIATRHAAKRCRFCLWSAV